MSDFSAAWLSQCKQTTLLLVGDAPPLQPYAEALSGVGRDIHTTPLAQLSQAFIQHRPDVLFFHAAIPTQLLLDELAQLPLSSNFDDPLMLMLGVAPAERIHAFIAAGGDDVITDAPDSELFQSRLAHHCHYVQCRRELSRHRALVAREEAVARTVLSSVVRDDCSQQWSNLRWQLSPRALFSGDLILAEKSPGGKIYLLLGDFPGHGLAASVGVLPVSDIFYTMTAKGFELVEILSEINQRLKTLLPVEGFFACSLLEVDWEQGVGAIWNGGLSCLLLQRAQGGVERLESRHTPLGILENLQLDRTLESFTLQTDDHLLLSTSGQGDHALELDVPGLLGGVADCIGAELQQTLERVSVHLQSYLGQDEVSLLVLRMGRRQIRKQTDGPIRLQGSGCSTPWHYDIRLDPEGLRSFDPRPMLTQLLVEVQGLQRHRERLYTLVAELFSNALEHGVLQLDSALKSSPEGFAQYYLEREERLAQLDRGFVRFRLEHSPCEGGGVLSIEVEDSGQGFDYQARAENTLGLEGFCGRGIGLIQQMAEDVVYFSPGNRVKITCSWTHA